MEQKIFPSERRVRPARLLLEQLAPQFLGDAEGLGRTPRCDPVAPIGVFAISYRLPVPGHEVANAARDHPSIVAPAAPDVAVLRIICRIGKGMGGVKGRSRPIARER